VLALAEPDVRGALVTAATASRLEQAELASWLILPHRPAQEELLAAVKVPRSPPEEMSIQPEAMLGKLRLDHGRFTMPKAADTLLKLTKSLNHHGAETHPTVARAASGRNRVEHQAVVVVAACTTVAKTAAGGPMAESNSCLVKDWEKEILWQSH
jgi:hypothetical protein